MANTASSPYDPKSLNDVSGLVAVVTGGENDPIPSVLQSVVADAYLQEVLVSVCRLRFDIPLRVSV